LEIVAPAALAPDRARPKPAMKRALIVWGGWEGHQPRECAELLATRLQAHEFTDMPEQLEITLRGMLWAAR